MQVHYSGVSGFALARFAMFIEEREAPKVVAFTPL